MSTEIEIAAPAETTGLVDVDTLLVLIWPNVKSRPSLRTVRTWTQGKLLPHVRLGRLIYYDVAEVRAELARRKKGPLK